MVSRVGQFRGKLSFMTLGPELQRLDRILKRCMSKLSHYTLLSRKTKTKVGSAVSQ